MITTTERLFRQAAFRNSHGQQAAIRPANNEAEVDPIHRANSPLRLDLVLDEISESEREAGLCRDTFPVSQIRVEGDRLVAGTKELLLDDEGLRRLCKVFKAPAKYLASLTANLRTRIFREHFAEGRYASSRVTDKNTAILSRDGRFRDFVRSDLLTLDNAAVVQAMREGINAGGGETGELEVQNFLLDDESFALDVVSPQIAGEVRPGDVIRGGVHIEHSQFGGQATQVLAYVHRLVCANGLVQRRCLGESRRTPRTRRLAVDRPQARDMQMFQIRKLVNETWGGLQEKLSVIQRLRDKPVDIRSALEGFLRRGHLFSRILIERLLEAWEEEGSESTGFGALNALTRVATHSQELPRWQRDRLARLAGIFANQEVHLCPRCYSVLAGR